MITWEVDTKVKCGLLVSPEGTFIPNGCREATEEDLRKLGYTRSNAMAGLWDMVAAVIGARPGESYGDLAKRTVAILELAIKLTKEVK